MNPSLTLKSCLSDLGVERFSHIPLNAAVSGQTYLKWLDNKQQSYMGYIAENKEARLNPEKTFSEMRSALVVTQDYFPHTKKEGVPILSPYMTFVAAAQHVWRPAQPSMYQ